LQKIDASGRILSLVFRRNDFFGVEMGTVSDFMKFEYAQEFEQFARSWAKNARIADFSGICAQFLQLGGDILLLFQFAAKNCYDCIHVGNPPFSSYKRKSLCRLRQNDLNGVK
jgi:hypothetical protein